MNARVVAAGRVLVAAMLVAAAGMPSAADEQQKLSVAPPGTRFTFEVIESHDASYLGDTPGHMGRDGGLKFRPNVALGDGVFRSSGDKVTRIGTVNRVVWDRVSGGLTVEFDPAPLVRVAVGDEVWMDLNPAPAAPSAAQS
ncbi:MAG: hypothetical protein ACKO4T_14605 [Planctomycetaceae bacterium]